MSSVVDWGYFRSSVFAQYLTGNKYPILRSEIEKTLYLETSDLEFLDKMFKAKAWKAKSQNEAYLISSVYFLLLQRKDVSRHQISDLTAYDAYYALEIAERLAPKHPGTSLIKELCLGTNFGNLKGKGGLYDTDCPVTLLSVKRLKMIEATVQRLWTCLYKQKRSVEYAAAVRCEVFLGRFIALVNNMEKTKGFDGVFVVLN